MATAIHEHGYWLSQDGHYYDRSLADALVAFFRGQTVVDFGCGLGQYVNELRRSGIDASGFDGNPDTRRLTGGTCHVLDLAVPMELGRSWDWVLCLETGEHIPPEYEAPFVANLDRHNTRGIVLSWAPPGQVGQGHVNCQPLAYVCDLFTGLGYTVNDAQSLALRKASFLPWFQQNLLVLHRRQPA